MNRGPASRTLRFGIGTDGGCVVARADNDRRADRFRWAVAIVPLLGICCIVISVLVLLGLVELGYGLLTHRMLFALR